LDIENQNESEVLNKCATNSLLKLIPEENNNLTYIHKEVIIETGRVHATTYLHFINAVSMLNFHIKMTAYQLIITYVFHI